MSLKNATMSVLDNRIKKRIFKTIAIVSFDTSVDLDISIVECFSMKYFFVSFPKINALKLNPSGNSQATFFRCGIRFSLLVIFSPSGGNPKTIITFICQAKIRGWIAIYVNAGITRSHVFSIGIDQLILAALLLAQNFFCERCLRVDSALKFRFGAQFEVSIQNFDLFYSLLVPGNYKIQAINCFDLYPHS